jgi:serine/threonine protein kinase, bacterial
MSLSLYPIIKKLGEGGFCTTYLATNTLMPSQPYCVVKQLTPTSTDPQVQQLIKDRFKQEAITLENLGKNSNGKVPSLYAYFVEHGEFYLIQEYIDGQTLNERVQTQGRFTEIQVRQLLIDILPTLVYVHQWGIVHRDIKPENIMLRQSDNKPILIDFGAVKETMSTMMTSSGNTAKSIVIGTPGFMPLEQMSGRPMFASDIYALGLTAIYLLTGKMPAEIETDPFNGNINWQSLAPRVSQQFVKVLNKAIQPLSRDRYKNAQEMLQDLNTSSPPFTPLPIESHILTPNGSGKTVYVPTPKTISNSGSSQANPLIAALIGVIIGGGLIAGFLMLGQNSSRKESDRDKTNSQQTVTNSSKPVTNSNSQGASDSNQTKTNSQSTVTNNNNPVTTSNSQRASNSNQTKTNSQQTVPAPNKPVITSNSNQTKNDSQQTATEPNNPVITSNSQSASNSNQTKTNSQQTVPAPNKPVITSNSNQTKNDSQQTVNEPNNPVATINSKTTSNSNSPNARSNASSRESTDRNTDREPIDTVRDYYSKIHSRNYSGAWDSLPTLLQNDRSVHPNGYNSFLNWWANQVADVEIKQTNLVSQTDRDAVVDVDIEYLMRAGSVLPYSMRYFLVKDDRNHDWTIQKIRLVKNSLTRQKL